MNDAEELRAIGDRKRRASGARDLVRRFDETLRDVAALLFHESNDRIRGAFSELPAVDVHATHARISRERDKVRFVLGHLAPAYIEFLFREHHNRTALGRLVRETDRK